MNCRGVLLAVLTFTVAGCGSSPTPSDSITSIRATTSFACFGYCKTTLEITPTHMAFLEESPRGDRAPRQRTAAVSADEWRALLEAVDRRRVESLPERIGCPDCADGGAESLEIVGTDWQRRVTFELGAALPELQPLLDRIRALRLRFTGPQAEPPPFTSTCRSAGREVFTAAPAPPVVIGRPPKDGLMRTRYVTLNIDALVSNGQPTPIARFNLFDDVCLDVRMVHFEGGSSSSWIGSIEGSSGSYVGLSFSANAAAGSALGLPDAHPRIYQISSANGAVYAVYEIDSRKLPAED